jgi:general secretion pathway protein G
LGIDEFEKIGHVDTKMKKTAFQIVYLQDRLNEYNRTNSRFPSTEQGLKLLAETIDDKGHPYLTRVPKDPWGNEYHYRSPGIRNKGAFDLWSYGSDNKLGGNEDHSRDITNWD